MRILLLNPNTSADLTDKLAAQARGFAKADTDFIARTAAFGARHIGSRTTFAIAGHAAVDLAARWFAEKEPAADAAILGCFGDPGLDALREICPFPVVALADAAIESACADHRRFAIVTGGAAWVPMLTEQVGRMGLSDRLAAIRTLPATGIAIGNEPERFLEPLAETARACVESDGADVVILGGAGLVGFPAMLAPRLPFPLIDCLEVAVRRAEASQKPAPRDYAVVETIGLGPALERLMAGDRPT
jgi:Asp/Glu/hydantoin racemase